MSQGQPARENCDSRGIREVAQQLGWGPELCGGVFMKGLEGRSQGSSMGWLGCGKRTQAETGEA